MDPDANLAEQIKSAEGILHDYDSEGEIDPEEAARLAELVLALEEWIRHGGFLPAKWSRRPLPRSSARRGKKR